MSATVQAHFPLLPC